jgi:hypothetical protein
VQPSYSVTSANGVVGPRQNVGSPFAVPAGWFGGTTGLAVGTISTYAGAGPEFPATWTFMEVLPGGQGAGDTTDPVAKAPTQSLIANSTIVGATTVPTKLAWSATDSGSGVASYELERSTDGGATWTSVALPSPTAKNVTLKLGAGSTNAFRVRATDNAGNVSAWNEGPTFKVNLLQETNAAIAYDGAWSTQNLTSASGGALRFASAAGASASLPNLANALNVAWVAPKAADRGKAEAWVDGALAGTVDLYTATLQPRKAVFVANGLNPGASHTLEVRVLGTKNASSSGTRADVDAFVVLERVP